MTGTASAGVTSERDVLLGEPERHPAMLLGPDDRAGQVGVPEPRSSACLGPPGIQVPLKSNYSWSTFFMTSNSNPRDRRECQRWLQ